MSHDTTRDRIIQAAGPIFAELGYDGATVRQICKAAEVNVASIKYYFGDKKSLYIETIKLARLMRAERYPFPDWSDETSPEEKLYDFVSALLRRLTSMQNAPWQVNLLMRELIKPDDACRIVVKEYFQPMFEAMLSIVDQLVKRPLSETERMKIGFSIIGQCLHYRFGKEVVDLIVPPDQRPQFAVEQVADHITRFCLGGLSGYCNSNINMPGAFSTVSQPTDSTS